MEKEIIAKIIVDLYEIRVSLMHRYTEKSDIIMNDYKYHFFSSTIAQLCSKYKINEDDIREELYNRRLKEFKN